VEEGAEEVRERKVSERLERLRLSEEEWTKEVERPVKVSSTGSRAWT